MRIRSLIRKAVPGHQNVLRYLPYVWPFAFLIAAGRAFRAGESTAAALLYGLGGMGCITFGFVVAEVCRRASLRRRHQADEADRT